MEVKKCRQCGDVKPIELFRPSYNGNGTYTICRSCEQLNSRAKYLMRKGAKATEDDKLELASIMQLYELQRACGLRPPRTRRDEGRKKELEEAMEKYKTMAAKGPKELQHWLTVELTDVPEYYLDTVYEQLKAKYMPKVGMTAELLPVYDTRYADILDKILDRFNAYEDTYYKED